MYTKNELVRCLKNFGFLHNDNVLIHSSMKSIGEVDGGADTVLDLLMEYFGKDGNIALPSHSWSTMSDEHNLFDYENEPSCVGILTEMFRKRKGVIRSLHPTHSISIYGKDKVYFTKGEEHIDTPCNRNGCWGKLLDMDFKIMFLGCSPKRNTFLHGVEEWNDVPNRLTENYCSYKNKLRDETIIDIKLKRHYNPKGDISGNYDRIQPYMEKEGLAIKGKFGDADCLIEKAADIYKVTTSLLKADADFFGIKE